MFEYRVSWNSVSDDRSAVVGDDGSGCETCVPRRLHEAHLMFVSILSGARLETWREFCVFTWTAQFVVDRVPFFQSSVEFASSFSIA